MPTPRAVLTAIDTALIAQVRHPRLFAAHLHKGHTCERLARTFATYRATRGEPVGGRLEMLDAERPDQEWEDAEARRRAEKFAPVRHDRASSLRAARERQTSGRDLLRRFHRALIEAERRSTVAAASTENGHGQGDSAAPPRQQEFDFTDADRLIRSGVEMYEAVLDEAAGLGAARDLAEMSKFDKDRKVLFELAHLTPAQIEVQFGGKLGAVSTVQTLRRWTRRSAEKVARLHALGYSQLEIRGDLCLDEDDMLLAREWIASFGVKQREDRKGAQTPVPTTDPGGSDA